MAEENEANNVGHIRILLWEEAGREYEWALAEKEEHRVAEEQLTEMPFHKRCDRQFFTKSRLFTKELST